MPNVTVPRGVIINRNPNIHPAKPGVNPTDLKTAGQLKKALTSLQIKFGAPLDAKHAPKEDAFAMVGESKWVAPNGDKLFPVQLSGKPPAGSADMQSKFALVDPKSNKFYTMIAGGITGRTFAYGPSTLPNGLKFTGKNFTDADIKVLTKAANKPGKVELPKAKDIKAAFEAWQFRGGLQFKAKGPAASSIIGSVPFKSGPQGFDTYKYTALVLKSNPDKVIIERSGGKTGAKMYSQTIDTTAWLE